MLRRDALHTRRRLHSNYLQENVLPLAALGTNHGMSTSWTMGILLGHSIRLPLAPEMEVVHKVTTAVHLHQGAGRSRESRARVSGVIARGKSRTALSTANILA